MPFGLSSQQFGDAMLKLGFCHAAGVVPGGGAGVPQGAGPSLGVIDQVDGQHLQSNLRTTREEKVCLLDLNLVSEVGHLDQKNENQCNKTGKLWCLQAPWRNGNKHPVKKTWIEKPRTFAWSWKSTSTPRQSDSYFF